MQRYRQLLGNCDLLQEAVPLPLPDEITLQSIWFNGQFGRTFYTTDHLPVVIRQLGFWNRSAGPDFLNASAEINGIVHTGPLEIDIRASDWETHGHSENPAFDDTILHVIFEPPSQTHYTRTSQHREVPKIIVPPHLIQQALQHPLQATTTAHAGRCSTPLQHMPLKDVDQLMQEAARHRCHQKAKRLQIIHETHGKDQALWIALAETLGYRPNKINMVLLTQRLPIHYLQQHTHLAFPLLFGVAGFLHPEIHEKSADDSKLWLQDLWQTWWKHRSEHEVTPERRIPWSFQGIRPINHPQRRIAALAHIASHWPTFRKLSLQPKLLTPWLSDLRDPFWSHHFTLTSERKDSPLALIGKDRIQDLLVNHLLPLRISQGDDIAWQHYLKLPAPATSEPVQRALIRLFGKRDDIASFSRKAWQHQALLQIYHDFCLQDNSDCAHCPFPEQLRHF